MSTSFLLFFQESLAPPEEGEVNAECVVELKGGAIQKDTSANGIASIPPAATTKTKVLSEGPDHSFMEETTDVLPRAKSRPVYETLTLTYVHAEEPRKDDKNLAATRVIPTCSSS